MKLDRLRFVIGLAGLILINTAWSVVLDLITRVAPILPDSIFLFLGSDIIHQLTTGNLSTLFINGILYLAVFYSLIDDIYSEKLLQHLETHELQRKFKILVAVHTFIIYLFIQIYTRLFSADSIVIMGFNWMSVWMLTTIILPIFLFAAQISIGYLLSSSEDGLFQPPNVDSPALAVAGQFDKPDIFQYEIKNKKPFWIWLDSSVYTLAPAAGLAGIIWISTLSSPLVEITLIVGILISFLPDKSQTIINNFDIEKRFATMFSYARYNIKSAAVVSYLFLTIFISSIIAIIIGPKLFYAKVAGTGQVDMWLRLGYISAIVMYVLSLVKFLFSIIDRLPWFLSSWEKLRDHLEFDNISQPDDTVPKRFELGPTLPTVYLIYTLYVFVFPQSQLAIWYRFIWILFPISVIFLVYTRSERIYPPKQDNRIIAYTASTQVTTLMFALLLPVGLFVQDSREIIRIQLFGLSTVEKSFVILIILFMCILTYYIPEIILKLKYPYKYRDPRGIKEILSAGEKRTYIAGLILNLVVLILSIVLVNTIFGISRRYQLFFSYGIFTLVILIGIFSKHDREYFQQGSIELDKKYEILVLGLMLLWMLLFLVTLLI